jgi:hypothetical protein
VLDGQLQTVHSLVGVYRPHAFFGSRKPIHASRMRNVAPVKMWRSTPKVAAQAWWRFLNAT